MLNRRYRLKAAEELVCQHIDVSCWSAGHGALCCVQMSSRLFVSYLVRTVKHCMHFSKWIIFKNRPVGCVSRLSGCSGRFVKLQSTRPVKALLCCSLVYVGSETEVRVDSPKINCMGVTLGWRHTHTADKQTQTCVCTQAGTAVQDDVRHVQGSARLCS